MSETENTVNEVILEATAKLVQQVKNDLNDSLTKSGADKAWEVIEPRYSILMNGVVNAALDNGVEESKIMELIQEGTVAANKKQSK